jgi:hypothetical protein
MDGKCPLQVIDDNLYQNTRWLVLEKHLHLGEK